LLRLKDIYLQKFSLIILVAVFVLLVWSYYQFSLLYVVVVFTVLFFVDMFLTFRLNAKITDDIELIQNSLSELVNKNYDISLNPSCCQDFEDISKDIKVLAKKLQKREKQKKNYTNKLKAITKNQSDIISAISHEFKNPVSAIIGYTQTVKEDDELTKEMRLRFLDKVLNNANKISFMIDRLSLAIKLENKNIALKKSKFELKTLAQTVKEMLLQKYRDREIVVEIQDDMRIFADKTMFENLLINLVENALKYSEDEVIVRVKNSNLEVIDKGLGIEKTEIENLTKKFYRVDTLSWDNSIGVGLYIVKYILKLHDSSLLIESEKGKGSKFYFSLINFLP